MKNANASFSYVEVPPYAASVTAPVVCPLWGHKRTHAPQQTVYLLDHFIGWSDARKILKVIPAQLRHGLRKCHRSRELPQFFKKSPATSSSRKSALSPPQYPRASRHAAKC